MERRERKEGGGGAADGADKAEGGWRRGPQIKQMERREFWRRGCGLSGWSGRRVDSGAVSCNW